MEKGICIQEIGSFYIGGRHVSLEGLPSYEASMTTDGAMRSVDPNGDFWTGQMYVQFVKLADPKAKYPLMLWHGGGLAGSCWETTPDGREGWQMYFLRQGHDVYISDAVERGRASWSRYPEIYATEPIFRPYAHAWESMRIGAKYDPDPQGRKAYPGSQYPVNAFETFMRMSVPRWSSNNEATQAAYDEYVQKVGPCVIIAHSQGCSFAAHAAYHQPDMVKALVFLEPSAMPDTSHYDVNRVKDIPQLFIWGDFLDCCVQWNKSLPGTNSYYKTVRRYYGQLEKVNRQAIWMELPDVGIAGNTHMMMHDKNSLEIAALVETWLDKIIQ